MAEILSERQIRTLWFVRLRWGAILLMLSVILTSIYPGHLRFPLIPNLIIIGIGILYNLIYPFLVRRWRPFSENLAFTYLRGVADLFIITLAVHFTGGVESPFKLLYLLEMAPISFAGLKFISYTLAGQASLMYLCVTIPEALGLIRHYRLIVPPGTLYLDLNYGIAKAVALFLSSCLLIYIATFLNDRLHDKQKEVEDLSASRLDFMNMVVHELRTPLTSMLEALSICAEGNLGPMNEKQKEMLGLLSRQTNRLNSLVGDLLNLARLESGVNKFEKRTVSLERIAEDALFDFQIQFNEKNIQIIRLYGPELPLVEADRDKMLEVFVNLLANALKYSPPGGKIFISIGQETGRLKVSIRDEGEGISPDDLPNIFNKFYRSVHTDPGHKGTGLGLSICRSIIERHGGKIWADSPGLGQGSTFVFTLPLK